MSAATKRTSNPRTPERARAKVFMNGRSQAIRLPKEFRMPGSEVLVHRVGNAVVLEPADAASGWPKDYWKELEKFTRGLPEFTLPDDPVPPPIRGS